MGMEGWLPDGEDGRSSAVAQAEGLVSPGSGEMPCVPKMLLFHWGRLPPLQQPERGLELGWTPCPCQVQEPCGYHGPLAEL